MTSKEPRNDATKRLMSKFSQALKEPRAFSASDVREKEQLIAYRRALAVLHCFTFETISPADGEWHMNPRQLLYEDVEQTSGGASRGLFSLKPEVRQATLKTFGSREEMFRALEANPVREMTSLQQMWESYLQKGSVAASEMMSYNELINLGQILSWLDGADKSLPNETEVLRLIREKSVLASIEHLVDSSFTGRKEEIRTINEFLDFKGPITDDDITTEKGAFTNQLSAWSTLRSKPPIVLVGAGGIGKSALLGKVLIDLMSSHRSVRIPIAYLAFDRSSFRIELPFTILVEAASQIATQFPDNPQPFEAFLANVRRFRDARGSLLDNTGSLTRERRLIEIQETSATVYKDFSKMLRTVTRRHNVQCPVLIVLDTFEEVQYRDKESLGGFWQMIEMIQSGYEGLRVIIAGRGSVQEFGGPEKFKINEQSLIALRLEDRIELLRTLGVKDENILKGVAEQIGGNPLSLHLAANVITSGDMQVDSSGLKDLSTRKWLLFQVDEQLIQGQLYKRILDHIHDPRVRKLAHPGMVLRQVYPEIILHVLAPVCHLGVYSISDADAIFEQLKREHGLVKTGPGGKLVYRSEIREAMVRLLRQDKAEEVRELHRAAILYYSSGTGKGDRAEEMFHRLALGEDDFIRLDQRWTSGIEQSVVANLSEYPDEIKAWLASRLSLEVNRKIFINADLADWERNTTRKVKTAMVYFDFNSALKLLSERRERTGSSPLFALEAKIRILQGDLQKAEALLQVGIETVTGSGNRGRLAELYWLLSQVQLIQERPMKADDYLAQAETVMTNADDTVPLVHILCQRILIRDAYAEPYKERSNMLRVRLNSALERLQVERVYTVPFVIQLALPLLGTEFPTTSKLFGSYNFPSYQFSRSTLIEENLRGIEPYREPWEEDGDNYSSAHFQSLL